MQANKEKKIYAAKVTVSNLELKLKEMLMEKGFRD